MLRFTLAIVLAVVPACHRDSAQDYVATVQHGLSVIPQCEQIEELLGEADHFITHYGFGKQPLVWNTEVHFNGGFSLTMQMDVFVDYSTNEVRPTDTATFMLLEYGDIEVSDGGVVSARGEVRSRR